MDLEKRNSDLIEVENTAEFFPVLADKDLLPSNKKMISYTQMAGMGQGSKTIGQALKNYVKGEASGGLYKVTVNPGQVLASFKDGSGYLGSTLNNAGQVAGQARLNPVYIQPGALAMSAVLVEIGQKMDRIIELQEEILDFLVEKDKSELRSDVFLLEDIMKKLQFNLDNEEFNRAYLNKALDIKHRASDKIILYRRQIDKNINTIKRELDSKLSIQVDKKIKEHRNKIQVYLSDYKLALYSYSFSSYIEVMLLKNYSNEYLGEVLDDMYQSSINYRAQYTLNYNLMEAYSKNSLEYRLSKGIAKGTEVAGKQLSKIPLLKKKEVDDTLLKLGNKLEDNNSKRVDNIMDPLIDREVSFIKPFVDNIKAIQEIQSKPLEIYFDEEGLYFESLEN